MVHAKPHGLLATPRVTFDKEDGRTVSAYMELREGVKAVGCVQPNPNALVFFYVAEDGVPIGIRFHEPASGVAVCELVDRLAVGPDGPEGVGREARFHFFTEPAGQQKFLRALKETLIGMEDQTEPDACPA